MCAKTAKRWVSNKKSKKDLKLDSAILHVKTTENNTIVTLSDANGNKIFGWWTWLYWFKWAKQNTPYAAEITAKWVLADWIKYWLKRVGIIFKWVWLWREGIFKAISDSWMIEIDYIKEDTSLQFAWCKWVRQKRN